MANQSDIARLEGFGLQLFPCAPTKQPRVPRGHDWRDPYPYQWTDTDLIGVVVPDDCVVLDIDNVDLFRQSGLEITSSVASATRRDGGLHIYYRTDGRDVPQVTEGATFGYDTRVGGLGYVIAWYPDDWKDPSEWALAPEFVYEAPGRKPEAPRAPGDPLGTRRDILSFLGRLAMNPGMTEADYLAVLLSRFNAGSIVSLDASRPWTKHDLSVLAHEAAKWEPLVAAMPPDLMSKAAPEQAKAMNAATLLDMDIPPLKWRIPGLMPEGLGLIAAPPKSGKSVFSYQVGVELAFGGSVLGIEVPKGPVLYYALEDGPRRSQQRVRDMIRGRRQGLSSLELRWTAPRLGGELEKEVHEWLGMHPDGLVIIDVLAKVRPAGGGASKNAYDVDYDALAGIHRVTQMNPGSTVLIVTHDRKAGSDDWMTRVTGTRGVTGAADFVIYIDRDRGKPVAKIIVSGRDVEDQVYECEFDVSGWRPAGIEAIIGSMSPVRQTIFNWLAENGPAWQADIADATGLDHDVVRHRVRDMAKDGEIATAPDRLGYRVTRGDEYRG